MRAAFAVILAILASPALAVDQSVVPQPTAIDRFLAQAKGKATCCKRCSKGIPCGNTCIAANRKCKTGPGCAC